MSTMSATYRNPTNLSVSYSKLIPFGFLDMQRCSRKTTILCHKVDISLLTIYNNIAVSTHTIMGIIQRNSICLATIGHV